MNLHPHRHSPFRFHQPITAFPVGSAGGRRPIPGTWNHGSFCLKFYFQNDGGATARARYEGHVPQL